MEELAAPKNAISERNIREIHSLVLKQIDAKYAGLYRDIMVRISGASHVPPDPLQVPDAMRQFAQTRLKKSKVHPAKQAALAHLDLVGIHPFVDGNGRTSRLLIVFFSHSHFFYLANVQLMGNPGRSRKIVADNVGPAFR